MEVDWHKSVWNSANYPKMAYCTYFALLNRLPTRERCGKWNKNSGNINCLLCKTEIENIEHLFFDCPYSKHVWFIVKNKLNINQHLALQNIRDNIHYFQKAYKGKKADFNKATVMLTTAIYFIWKERNNRLHNKVETDSIQLWKTIEIEFNVILHKFNRNNNRSHNNLDDDNYENFVEEYLQKENFNENSQHPAANEKFVVKPTEFIIHSFSVEGCCSTMHTRNISYKGSNHNFNFNTNFKSFLNKNLHFALPDMHRKSRLFNSELLFPNDGQIQSNIVIFNSDVPRDKAIKNSKHLSDFAQFNVASKITADNPLRNQILTCQESNKAINTDNFRISKRFCTNADDFLPDYSKRCRNNAEEVNNSSLAISEQKLGNTYYISKLNKQIYQLSVWQKGESSKSFADACTKFSRSDLKESPASILNPSLDLKSGVIMIIRKITSRIQKLKQLAKTILASVQRSPDLTLKK